MDKRVRFFLRQLCILPILFCMGSYLFAQIMTPKKIEKDLSEVYSKIFPFYYGNNDSLKFYSSIFSNKIIAYIDKYPSTLDYSFQTMVDSRSLNIATSKDNLFRIYSWDTWLGGTEHDFENIFQYKSHGKVYSRTVHDTSIANDDNYTPFYSDIYSLYTNNKTYYLAIGNEMYSTQDVGQSISIFTIEDNQLNDTVKLIKTSTRFTNTINVPFNFFKVTDTGERPIRILKYDEYKKIIYIPIVLEDGTVTKRFIIYKFNGKYFEKMMTQKSK
jgi:hypothetical protein